MTAHLPPDKPAPATKHVFIRSYQACVPCRKRKVRCDLGDPGNPSDPPCRRCRREHKECFFQDLRTKKGGPSKPSESPPLVKRMRTNSPLDPPAIQPGSTASSQQGSFGEVFPAIASASSLVGTSKSPNESATAERILQKEVHNANEALNLLFEAAAESRSETDEGITLQNRLGSRFSGKNDANVLAWRDFWCVKAGWMTDVEAKCYIDL